MLVGDSSPFSAISHPSNLGELPRLANASSSLGDTNQADTNQKEEEKEVVVLKAESCLYHWKTSLKETSLLLSQNGLGCKEP